MRLERNIRETLTSYQNEYLIQRGNEKMVEVQVLLSQNMNI